MAPNVAGASSAAAPTGMRVYTGYADCPTPPSIGCGGSTVTNPNYPSPWFGAAGVTFIADPNVVNPANDSDPDTSAVRIDNSGTTAFTIQDLLVTCSGTSYDLWGSGSFSYPYTLNPGSKFVFSSTNGDNFDGSDGCTSATVNVNVGGVVYTYSDDVANSGGGAIHGYPGFDESTPWTLVGGAKTKIYGTLKKLAGGAVGVSYSQFVAAQDSNGAPAYSLTSGSLPPGLTLSTGPYPSDETISGTPTTKGKYTFTLKVTDANGDTGSLAYSIVVGGTVTALTSSANPSSVGQQVTYTATVSPNPGGGTVTFKDGTTAISGCTAVPTDTTTGVATCSVTYGSSGTHTITAHFSGDTNFLGSASKALNQTVS